MSNINDQQWSENKSKATSLKVFTKLLIIEWLDDDFAIISHRFKTTDSEGKIAERKIGHSEDFIVEKKKKLLFWESFL